MGLIRSVVRILAEDDDFCFCKRSEAKRVEHVRGRREYRAGTALDLDEILAATEKMISQMPTANEETSHFQLANAQAFQRAFMR